VPRNDAERVLHRLKRIDLGDTLSQRSAARCIRELARDIDDLNRRIAALDEEIAELLTQHGHPLSEIQGVGSNLAAVIIAQAGDVRRFRNAAAFARFCGAAPIPCGSGQTADRHRLHRGGNRQLNAALYRIAIVQQRHHPQAKAFLARKLSEGKATWPGCKQVWRRFHGDGSIAEDTVALAQEPSCGESLLHPVLRAGRRVKDLPALAEIRAHAAAALASLPASMRRLEETGVPVQISAQLRCLAARMDEARRS